MVSQKRRKSIPATATAFGSMPHFCNDSQLDGRIQRHISNPQRQTRVSITFSKHLSKQV